jgi:hypothetical protein
MEDLSNLDKRYFDSNASYNCPFCKRNHVPIAYVQSGSFHWSNEKTCYFTVVQCSSCQKNSLHHSFTNFLTTTNGRLQVKPGMEIEDLVFHSIPTSFFVLDSRIPSVLRELLSEADGCLNMNFLTGASVCIRKSIYEFIFLHKVEGSDYETKIKSLKALLSSVDPTYFDVLSHLQDMTSDKVHEQSWKKWDSKHIRFFIELLRNLFHEVYVVPEERKLRSNSVIHEAI